MISARESGHEKEGGPEVQSEGLHFRAVTVTRKGACLHNPSHVLQGHRLLSAACGVLDNKLPGDTSLLGSSLQSLKHMETTLCCHQVAMMSLAPLLLAEGDPSLPGHPLLHQSLSFLTCLLVAQPAHH